MGRKAWLQAEGYHLTSDLVDQPIRFIATASTSRQVVASLLAMTSSPT
jgi:hypothetical protein